MWIRGPGIDPGQSVTTPVLTIDLAPTLLDLAGVVQKYDDMDGLTITPLLIKNNTDNQNSTSVNVGSIVVLPHNEAFKIEAFCSQNVSTNIDIDEFYFLGY